MKRWLVEDKPGYGIRDRALYNAARFWRGATPMSYIGPTEEVSTPEEMGVPKWTGSPEEASMVVKAALRHFGAADVGFVELDTNTTEKLIYDEDPDGKRIVISEDHEVPEETEDTRYLPKVGRWVISWTVQMSHETMFRGPTPLGSQTTTLSYEVARHQQNKLQAFLRGLGYWGAGEASTNSLGIAPAFGVMAGLGEIGRVNRMLTPDHGPMIRTFKMVTNLPLAPTKPIDAGIMDFCRKCKVCAEYCPSGALSMDTEPSWEVKGGWNNPGHKSWFDDAVACRTYWRWVGTNCGYCFAACPYAQKDKALVHKIVKATIGTTSIFNSAIATAGRLAYLDVPPMSSTTAEPVPLKDCDEWWTLDLPEYGSDTTRGHRDV
jgi:reductive dehalogenase